MKTCPNCHAQLDDNASFCGKCGAQFDAQSNQQQYQQPQQPQQPQYQQPQYQQPQYQQPYPPQPVYNPYDHTAEFTAQDISNGKLYALACYLLGPIGMILTLLGAKDSGFAMFHLRQSLKLTLVNMALGMLSIVLSWTLIIPIVGVICLLIMVVVQVIAFFQCCGGKAKEPAIVRSLGFLR